MKQLPVEAATPTAEQLAAPAKRRRRRQESRTIPCPDPHFILRAPAPAAGPRQHDTANVSITGYTTPERSLLSPPHCFALPLELHQWVLHSFFERRRQPERRRRELEGVKWRGEGVNALMRRHGRGWSVGDLLFLTRCDLLLLTR